MCFVWQRLNRITYRFVDRIIFGNSDINILGYQIVSIVAEHIDCMVKTLHNRSKYFAHLKHEHPHLGHKCKHQHVMDTLELVDIVDDCRMLVIVGDSLVMVVVLVLGEPILYFEHIPMECIVDSIHLVECLQLCLCRSWELHIGEDRNLDLKDDR